MAPASLAADPRSSLLAKERKPVTTEALSRPTSPSTNIISSSVKPLAWAPVRRLLPVIARVPAEPPRAPLLLPGLDVVGAALLAVGTGGDDVDAVGIAGARDT